MLAPGESMDFARRFLSRREAAAMLGLSERTLDRRIQDSTIPHARVGGRVMVPVEALNRLEAAALAVQ